MKATVQEAYQLMHDGTLALARVEQAGMRIDMRRLAKTIDEVKAEIAELTAELKTDEVWTTWRRRFGTKANLGSRPQLAKVLMEDLSVELEETEKGQGRRKLDEEALADIDLPFVRKFVLLEKKKKLQSTYLMGVRREVQDGYLHPSFSLNLARTYRSTSDHPNFQNIPIRDKEIGKTIRSCFVPRKGRLLVEIDYGSLEVRISACYNKDPVLIAYIEDTTKDMHRDMAMECYCLSKKEVTKEARFYAKNQFVFPEFYGSYYAQVAPSLWNVIERAGLKTSDGRYLHDHLYGHGIANYEDFERHIREVEERFWGNRFKVYAQWKLDWFRQYLRVGGFDMLTGFRVDGVYKRNDVINYPVQGSAFHCLLWSLIQLVRWLEKKRMESVIVGQIHDSIVADVTPGELDDFLAKAKYVMTVAIRKHWPWIIVPLVIEAEVSDTNWFEKKEYKI